MFKGGEPIFGGQVGPKLGVEFIPFAITSVEVSWLCCVRGVVVFHDHCQLLENVYKVLVRVEG